MVQHPSAEKAIVLHRDGPAENAMRLCRILEFFGIPFQLRELSELNAIAASRAALTKCAVMGALDIAEALIEHSIDDSSFKGMLAGAYFFTTSDAGRCEKIMQRILEVPQGTLVNENAATTCLKVNDALPELTGPLTNLQVSTKLSYKDSCFSTLGGKSNFTPIMTAGDRTAFLVTNFKGVPCFIATSSNVPDLDAPITQGFYDVKADFCSAVPLIMFLKYMFAGVIWQPVENGACLIIDDPLLRGRYACCDYRQLLHQMKGRGFTTDIAFIPWNWRRTSKRHAAFFTRESKHYSVSIHGCDHIAAEFGNRPYEDLTARARLAYARMRRHESGTGIRHEPIMVFPQGVFSRGSLGILKRAGYLAAVNTETAPVGTTDNDNDTCLRDVWDVAITRYGAFPLFTRRYANHGIENFAFDLLLGKPCLIVAHHEFFQDQGQAVLDLLDILSKLPLTLKWRSLGDVLRRACRFRMSAVGVHEYWMYASEVCIENGSNASAVLTVRKKEENKDLIDRVEAGDESIEWMVRDGHIEFSGAIAGGEKRLFRVVYKDQPEVVAAPRGLKYEFMVATRRLLSEMRDEAEFQRARLGRFVPRLRKPKSQNRR